MAIEAHNPFLYIADPAKGRPLFNADLYYGIPDLDPEIPANQVQVSIVQENGTVVAVSQPITTGPGGVPLYNGSPVVVCVSATEYSFKALNRHDSQTYYNPRVKSKANVSDVNFSFDTLASGSSSRNLQDATNVIAGMIVSTSGYSDAGDGGGNSYLIGSGFGAADGGSIIDLPGSGLQARGLFLNGVNITQFGASPSKSSSVNTARIQAAWNYAAPLGLEVQGSPGTFLITKSGSQINGRDYGLMIPDGLLFNGVNKGSCIIRADDSSDMDVITTNRVSIITNVELKNFTCDGNGAAQAGSPDGFNFWLHRVDGLRISNVTSIDPDNWGYRIQECNNVFISDVRSDNAANVNADGMHFVDTSNVVINGVNIYTEGDDGFIIECLTSDVDSYEVSGLIVKSPDGGVGAAQRGIVLLREDSLATAAHVMSNIKISAEVSDCKGQGVILTRGTFHNIKISAVVENCLNGLYLDPGDTNFPGDLINSSFEIDCINSTGSGLVVLEGDGSVINNSIDMSISNPGDGVVGATVRGTGWSGRISVDYNPFGNKTVFSSGINMLASDSNNLFLQSVGAGTNLLMQGDADGNNIRLGNLTGATVSNLTNSVGAFNNRFHGGKIEAPISLSAQPRFFGTAGADDYFPTSINMATNADGTVQVPHGLAGTPRTAFVQFSNGGVQYVPNVTAKDGTNITITLQDLSGSPITSGSYNVAISVQL